MEYYCYMSVHDCWCMCLRQNMYHYMHHAINTNVMRRRGLARSLHWVAYAGLKRMQRGSTEWSKWDCYWGKSYPILPLRVGEHKVKHCINVGHLHCSPTGYIHSYPHYVWEICIMKVDFAHKIHGRMQYQYSNIGLIWLNSRRKRSLHTWLHGYTASRPFPCNYHCKGVSHATGICMHLLLTCSGRWLLWWFQKGWTSTVHPETLYQIVRQKHSKECEQSICSMS